MQDKNMVDVISTFIMATGHDCVLYMKPGANKPDVTLDRHNSNEQ
jgi:hypothetical protein